MTKCDTTGAIGHPVSGLEDGGWGSNDSASQCWLRSSITKLVFKGFGDHVEVKSSKFSVYFLYFYFIISRMI